ncbi:MAG: hypothetical protein HQL16_02375 [Candidatus Omnitrophica bacterium]|nr:hypothetical protein [Candidatus Omnitrophota bacterium]
MDNSYVQVEKEIEPKDFLRVFFSKLPILCVVIVVALVGTYVALKFVTPLYEAQVKMLIAAQREIESPYYKENPFNRGADIVMTQSEVVKSKAVIERTVAALKLDERMPHLKQYNSSLKNVFLNSAKLVSSTVSDVKNFVREKILRLPAKKEEASNFQKAVDFLRRNIKVKRIIETDVFTLQVSDYDPAMAQKIANTLSRSYILFSLEQQMVEAKMQFGDKHPMVRQLEDNISQMQQTLSKDLTDVEAIGPASVKVIEQAEKPEHPASPKKGLIYGLALIMSVLCGVFLIVFYAYFDQTFQSPKDLEDYLNVPLLGSLPFVKKDAENFSKGGEMQDKLLGKMLRILSDQFYLLIHDKKIKTVLVTSVDPGEGVSSVVLNLGKMVSKGYGYKTLIVDCNMRTCESPNLYGNKDSLGLAEFLQKGTPLDKAIIKAEENLYFLPSGQTQLNPLLLFKSSKMAEAVEGLKGKFDLVLFDAPFLKEYQDSYVVVKHTDALVIVIDAQSSKRQVAKAFIDMFDDKAKIIGAVLNKRQYSIPETVYKRI